MVGCNLIQMQIIDVGFFFAYEKEEILADITRLRARIINVFKLGVCFSLRKNNTLVQMINDGGKWI